MSETADILDEKRALRARMKEMRAALGSAEKVRAADAIAEQAVAFLASLAALLDEGGDPSDPPPWQPVVSVFASLPDELRTWPLMRRLAGEGYRLALPVVQGRGSPLLFRAWVPGDEMDKGVWGIPEPKRDKPVLEPDILFVPLLAFDDEGWRIGYGGGFYDRTLRTLRGKKQVTAAGLAYDEQRVDSIPRLDYDQRLDWIVTPSGFKRFPG